MALDVSAISLAVTQRHPTFRAARASARVALVTCSELTDLDPDDRLLLAPLAAAGVSADAVVWDDPAVDWAAYDLAVIRSTWDYPPRREEFVAWVAGVPRLANPADVVAWNTDKRYLAELAARGIAVVPTTWVEPGSAWVPPAAAKVVIKPVVGVGGLGSGVYDLADPAQRRLAVDHVRRLQTAGRYAMVQPYLSAVDSHGETSVLFVAGRYSHAIRKGAILSGPDAEVEGLYRAESISAREPTAAERAVAEAALAALPFPAAELLYARVDLIPGPDGAPLLLELELTEPSMFVGTAPGLADRFAAAIAAACRRRRA
jgi:glutathione synthase/RimK-type ligase-like ATP-grasp enzyme